MEDQRQSTEQQLGCYTLFISSYGIKKYYGHQSMLINNLFKHIPIFGPQILMIDVSEQRKILGLADLEA